MPLLHRAAVAILLSWLLMATVNAQTLTDAGSDAEQAATLRVAERALQQFDNEQWDASWDLVGD